MMLMLPDRACWNVDGFWFEDCVFSKKSATLSREIAARAVEEENHQAAGWMTTRLLESTPRGRVMRMKPSPRTAWTR
jgi:hypothetical protein